MTATNLIIIRRGRLLAELTVADFVADAGEAMVEVVCSDPEGPRNAVAGPDVEVSCEAGSEEMRITGLPARAISKPSQHNPAGHCS